MATVSPVHRMGGKYYLTGWLSRYIPEHTCYVEPFCGAGHLLFTKTPSAVEILNDIDLHLITFFRVVKDPEKRQKLVEALEYMPYSRSLWQDIRSRWKQGTIPSEPVEASVEWFYMNRLTFAGDQKRGGFACPSVTGRNPAQSYFNAIDGFEDIARRLKGVTIECLSYEEVIRRYDSTGSLFFIDPPYMDADHYYEQGNFNQENHYALARLLHDVKGAVMLTHYANGIYDELYQGWHQFKYQSFKGSHKSECGMQKPVTTECLWTNFKPVARNKLLFEGINL